MSNQRQTVGALALELSQKEKELYVPSELQEEIHKGDAGINGLMDCVEINRKIYQGDFYIVCITKRERLLPNTIRTQYLARFTCPTPSWDEAVYRFRAGDGSVEFLWVIPDKLTCEWMLEFPDQVPDDHLQLRDYVLQMYNGTLLERAKRINGESADSPLLEKR